MRKPFHRVSAAASPRRGVAPRWASAVLLLLGCALSLRAAAQDPRSLQSIDVTPVQGDTLLLTLTLSGTAPEPVVFTVDNPARLSVDLPETTVALPSRQKKVNIGNVRQINAAQAGNRSRVVIELDHLAPYQVSVQDNRVLLKLSGLATPPSASARAPQMATTPATVAATGTSLANVDFRRGEKGEGRVVVSLSSPTAAVDVDEQGGKIIARFRDTAIPEPLRRRLDVLDFATPVKFVDVRANGSTAEIVVTPVAGADFEHLAYQSGSQFTIELAPQTAQKAEERRRSEPQYKGERISLSFQSVDIRSLLQIIADVAGTNMVVSDSVTGTLAMRLQNVPWDQALDIVLRTKGLGMRQEGNVMLVAPLAELAQRDKLEAEARAQQVQLAPLRSEIMQVNYAKGADIAALLNSSGNAILTERGRVTVDQRTNTLLIMETRERLAEIRELIAKLDIPIKQVLIESRIVVANNDFSRELGARFGVTSMYQDSDGNTVGAVSGSVEGAADAIGALSGGDGLIEIPGDLNVNLPASGNPAQIGLAILGADYMVDLELSALQAEGRGEVISSPRVISANATQASIEQGVEIPYEESTSSGATSVSFKKAVLSLNVIPQITPDDRIIMDLQVNNDTVGDTVTTSSGGAVPSIDTRKVSTQVLVENGQTVVLGGIYQQENRNEVSKVPLLGDIPLLGVLFRNKLLVSNKDELLIFISPKILRDGVAVSTGR